MEKETVYQPEFQKPFLIELVFKPKEPGHKLRTVESQLLSSYSSEILKEIEAEEKAIIEQERAK